jgi:hypothetical protein
MKANELSKLFLIWWQKENPEGKIYRNNAGCFQARSKTWVRYGIPNKGGSDFIAFLPKEYNDFYSTKYLMPQFYEIKTKNDRMSKDQIKFADMIVNMGGDYFIVHEYHDTRKEWSRDVEIGKRILSTDNISTKDFWIEKWSIK